MKAQSGTISLRALIIWSIAYFAFYVSFAGLSIYVFYANGGQTELLQTDEGGELLKTAKVLTTVYLGGGLVLLALWRLVYHHPVYNPAYLRWLRTTPWRRGMPLPGGSPFPGLPEVVLLTLVGMIAFWALPVFNAVWLLSAYGLVFTLLVVDPYIQHPRLMPGTHMFAAIVLAGLLILLWDVPWCVGAVALGIFVVALHALHTGLLHLPLHRESSDEEVDVNLSPIRLTGVEPEQLKPPVKRMVALGVSVLIGYWAGILHHLFEPESAAVALPNAFIIFAAVVRVGVYSDCRRPPLTLWQRFKTRQFILPGYDVIFVAPMLAILACITVLILGAWLMAYPPIVTGVAFFTGMMILLKGGPPRQHWQLTSDHRAVLG